jgi:hypothetical protein
MLQRELWIGQRRNLCRNLFGSLPVLPRRFNLGIVLFRFRKQVGESSRCSLVFGRTLLGDGVFAKNRNKEKESYC